MRFVPGLDPNAKIREQLHFVRYGSWPASYLERLFAGLGNPISRERAEDMAGLGREVVPGLRRQLRKGRR
jgi:hypothetical protein